MLESNVGYQVNGAGYDAATILQDSPAFALIFFPELGEFTFADLFCTCICHLNDCEIKSPKNIDVRIQECRLLIYQLSLPGNFAFVPLLLAEVSQVHASLHQRNGKTSDNGGQQQYSDAL
jgi:hypothetical protein